MRRRSDRELLGERRFGGQGRGEEIGAEDEEGAHDGAGEELAREAAHERRVEGEMAAAQQDRGEEQRR